jgi:acetylornithine aminotransferase
VEAELIKGDVACVIIEPIQGVGGLDREPPSFSRKKVCKANDVVLILDEVQSGFGRSGKFFAHQFHDIKPDIICMAKGMGRLSNRWNLLLSF